MLRVCSLVIATAAIFFLVSPAFAIPSPDIVVSVFSNAAQLLALMTAVAGSAAVSRSGMVKEKERFSGQRHWSAWLTRGLVLLFLVSVGVNILQWSRETDARTIRLSTNLTRASIEQGKAVGDTSLKTLPFSHQINHPQGITSDRLAALMVQSEDESASGINFIDVREPEEWEVGNLSGFTHVRYPDLLKRIDELRLKKSKNVLICYSGNRSSELCNELKKRGIDCSFVIGGYEKWLAEGKPVNFADGAEPDSLRALPPYPNSDRLLDTPEVQSLVSDSRALFVDVRYPKEFAREHLPGAVNMPIRKMPTSQLESAFKQLPKRPIIAPCYDKRSCFYAQVLGLRLHRLGFDFLGRYTVPREYFRAGSQQKHVSAWLNAHNATILGKIRRPFEDALTWIRQETGSLVLGIFLTVLLLRLALLPLTIKGERDQIMEQRLRPHLAGLKSRLADDPLRYRRAVRMLIESNSITPTRNLIGLAIQITLLLVLISAVSAIARPGSEPFLWISDIGRPDPLYLASIALGVLVFLHLQLAAVRNSPVFIAIRALAGAFFMVITLNLSAALNIYLISGVGLMLAQAAIIRKFVGRKRFRTVSRRVPLPQQVADLRDADRIPGSGRKAERLSLMMREGLPVPDGFVVPNALFSADGQLTETEQATVETFRRQLRLESMAVRSSGMNEDGEEQSYAGQFDTMLNVEKNDLQNAVTEIYKTLHGPLAAIYGNGEQMGGGVVVQKMIDADYAGILFTEHPMDSGAMLVEMTRGLGDKLATGTEAPDSYKFGRWSHLPLDAEEPPIDLGPLLTLGARAERMFEHPQDIEWAYKDGRYYLLQARNITVLQRLQQDDTMQTAFERERHRLLEIAKSYSPDIAAFAQNELSELLPQPTPLSLDLMQGLWQPGGSVDLACRSLGVPYDVPENGRDLLVSVFGRLYINTQEQNSRIRKGIGPIATFRLTRSAERLEHEFKSVFLPALTRELLPREAMDLGVLSTPDLITLLEDTCERYMHESHVQVDIINIAADFFVRSTERQFQKKKLSASAYLGQGANTIVHQAMSLLRKVREKSATAEEFLEFFGHRAPVDYELAMPRYSEDLDLMEGLVRNAASDPTANESIPAQINAPNEPTLALAVARARKFQVLKEEAKHHSLRELAVLRRILIELDTRLEFGGAIFYLHLDELAKLRNKRNISELRNLSDQRRQTSDLFASLYEPPAALTLQDIERLTVHGSQFETMDGPNGDLHGTLVAGSSEATGRARVLTNQNIDTVQEGEIVVARYMHPNWTPVLPRLTGIVTEVGGWLSHTSILAREYNVTTITGVKDAEYRIKTGSLIRLKLDGAIELLDDDLDKQERSEAHETNTLPDNSKQAQS